MSDSFIERLRQVYGDDYDYSKVVYKGRDVPVLLTCREHGEFKMSPRSLLIGRPDRSIKPHGCPECAGIRKLSVPSRVKKKQSKKTKFDFLKQARQVYGDDYDYSKVVYKGRDVPVLLTCRKHGEFKMSPRSLLIGRPDQSIKPHGCPECAGIRKLSVPSKVKKKQFEETDFDFLKEARMVHGDRYEYPVCPSKKFEGNERVKIPIICKKHGIFYQYVFLHLAGSNCPVCANRHQSLEYRRNDFIQRAKERHGDKFSYRNVVYVNNDTPVSIYCKEHKRLFSVSPDTHLRGGGGCPYCSNSTGEIDVRLWLEEHGIDFLYQYRVPNSNSVLSLKYLVADFYLPKHKTIIEFQGQQHYFNISHFYGNSKRTFELQLLRDETLRLYCKQNKLNLIEIKYDQQQSIPNILSQMIS